MTYGPDPSLSPDVRRRATSEPIRRHPMRVAVVGARGPLAAVVRGMSVVSGGRGAVPCRSEDTTLERLTRV